MITHAIVDPTRLTADQLIQLGQHTVHELARKANGTTTAYQLVKGRCLLALHRSRLYKAYGCSGATHYATRVMGMKAKEARTCRRVARLLEPLPWLTQAVQEGKIDWSKVREVVGVAAPETEGFWLEACLTMTYDEIQRLVQLTPSVGQLPRLSEPGETRPVCCEIRCILSAEGMTIMERAFRSLAGENGRVLPQGEALVLLAAEHLARRQLDDESLALQHKEARKDLDAQRERDRWLLAKCPARDILDLVAARWAPCPGNDNIQLVERATPPWDNPRLRYNPDARQPTEAQRQDLLRRDGYRCSTPGCPNHLFLHTHHIVYYCKDGPTLPENLVVLCSQCHRHVHDGDLRIEGQPGNLKFYDRKGRELQRTYELAVADWLNFWIGWSGKETDSHVDRWMNGLWSFIRAA